MTDLANTKVLCIVNNRNDSGPSPGYECSILGESKHGVFFETVNNQDIPEIMAEKCCVGFLKSVGGGCVFDQKLLPAAVLLMGLSDGVSRLAIRSLNHKSQKVLDLLELFFKVSYKLEEHGDNQILTVIGCGYRNQFMPM
ncbi:uncharacterized protein VICG_01479 [Vittaforma corneae ATCC 50505]|uniref:Uncharacterized protein n=1 Tax=Vittaforma corneae (strain ATCC 50505) TaxID=993615 RepID=L2GLW4_VITCO|nr:uncharacterized protein VICG_01479 [Vittaforma corneae ATCC 50505]ELA41495.1 hypothetical protein VICG_01479 [Vittaforma corneae ATCC 50505]